MLFNKYLILVFLIIKIKVYLLLLPKDKVRTDPAKYNNFLSIFRGFFLLLLI